MGLVGGLLPESGYPTVVTVFALLLMGIMLWACYRQIVRLSAMVWSALVWFRLGVGVFVGFGTAVPYLIDEASQAYIYTSYAFTDREAMKFLAMSTLSCLIVLAIARLFAVRVPPPSRKRKALAGRVMLMMAIAFLAMGGAARYGIVIPKSFGQTDVVVANWMSALGKSYAAGLFLLLSWTLQYKRQLIVIPVTLVAIDAMVGVLSWDKSEIVFTLAFAYLAVLYSHFSVKRAAAGLLALLGVIYLAQPIVHYGRSQIALGEEASVGQRFSVLADYFTSDGSQPVAAGVGRNPLLRLSYTAQATFFMDRYDRAMPGGAHEHVLAALVPRVLWPNKPNIGEAGAQAYYLMRGRTGTSIGMTHFAEAYWSFGWLGALLVFIPGGLILAFVTTRGVQLILDERWIQLPIVLLSLNIGYKVSGAWVPSVIGAFAMFVVLSIVLTLAERVLFPLASAPPSKRAALHRGGQYPLRLRSAT